MQARTSSHVLLFAPLLRQTETLYECGCLRVLNEAGLARSRLSRLIGGCSDAEIEWNSQVSLYSIEDRL